MIKISVQSAALAMLALAAGSAAAQSAGPAVPAPGSANAASVASHNREQNAGYNKVVGAMETAAPVRKGTARPAAAAEITIGSALRDVEGLAIGTIDSVDAEGAVVVSGESKVRVPLIAFGKDDAGLLLGITAARFHELMAKATSSAQ